MKSTLEIQPERSGAVHGTAGEAHDISQPVHAAAATQAGEAPSRQDASALQGLLARQFVQPAEAEAPAVKSPRAAPPLSPTRSRLLKSVAGLVLLASVGWMPLQRLFQVSSVEAVVNAQVVTLRAPVGGVVSEALDPLRVGATVLPGNVLMTVQNARADRAAIERVKENLRTADEDLVAVVARIDRLTTLRAAIAARVEDYRADRVLRVGADLVLADAQITSAQAVMDRAEAEVARQSSLAATGFSAQATRQTAERDLAVARASVDQAKARRAVLVVEAEALKAGRFFGDGYDDVPQSMQRLDWIDENLALLNTDKGKLEARVRRLTAEMQAEEARFDLASRATIAAPAGGQIWEILTSPGEQVVAGQPLVSVLDCSRLMVTTAVSESVYNTLSLGMPASFTFHEGGPAFAGRVVQLSGVAAAGSNFAIIPSALTKESYRATVATDSLGGNGTCPVGKTGRVVFGKTAS
ncbi:HlyD family secretion protein [Mycoplana ramosa]|uniref:HlyD family secretion protein n=1 Tax=Mycoplana ramosa TaxID=40837 RepID=A0ABW3YYG6_MYCRA